MKTRFFNTVVTSIEDEPVHIPVYGAAYLFMSFAVGALSGAGLLALLAVIVAR